MRNWWMVILCVSFVPLLLSLLGFISIRYTSNNAIFICHTKYQVLSCIRLDIYFAITVPFTNPSYSQKFTNINKTNVQSYRPKNIP